MASLKKYYSPKANSLLESVVALSIISICLYVAIMIYASVFTPKTTARFYSSQNKIAEAFFLMQVREDSLIGKYDSEDWNIEEEPLDKGMKRITVKYHDSIQAYPERSFYIPADE